METLQILADTSDPGVSLNFLGLGMGGLLIALVIAYFLFILAAFVSILRSPNYSTGLKALWFLVRAVTFKHCIMFYSWPQRLSFPVQLEALFPSFSFRTP